MDIICVPCFFLYFYFFSVVKLLLRFGIIINDRMMSCFYLYLVLILMMLKAVKKFSNNIIKLRNIIFIYMRGGYSNSGTNTLLFGIRNIALV